MLTWALGFALADTAVGIPTATITAVRAEDPAGRARRLAALRAGWSGDAALAEAPVVVGALALDHDGDGFHLRGDVHLWWTAAEDQEVVTLRWLPAAFGGRVTATGPDGAPLAVDASETLVDVRFPTLRAGEAQAITLRLDADVPPPPVPDDLGVFNATNLGLFATDGRIVALGHALPIVDGDARPLPEFGEHGRFPAAFWSVTLDVPVGWEAVGETAGVRAGAREVGLAAVPAGAVRRAGVAPEVVVVAEPGTSDEVLTHAAGSLAWHGARFGAYPWPSFTAVELPWLPVEGMEMSGFTFLRRGTRPVGLVAAHEVAHQWWYGVVGSDPRRHPWQDEALATWTAWRYWAAATGAALPPPPAERRAAYLPGAAYDLDTYANAIYRQAPRWFVAVAEGCGVTRVDRALERYAADHRFRMADPSDLVDALAPCGAARVERAYDAWVVGR